MSKNGRHVAKFKSRFQICKFLKVPDFPITQWSPGAGWLMAQHMYDLVKTKYKAMISVANFIALTIDGTSTVDKCLYIVAHVYVLQNRQCMPLYLHMQKLKSSNILLKALILVITCFCILQLAFILIASPMIMQMEPLPTT